MDNEIINKSSESFVKIIVHTSNEIGADVFARKMDDVTSIAYHFAYGEFRFGITEDGLARFFASETYEDIIYGLKKR